MTGVVLKRGNLDTEIGTGRDRPLVTCYGKMEAEVRWMHLQARDCQETTGNWDEVEQILPRIPHWEPTLSTG